MCAALADKDTFDFGPTDRTGFSCAVIHLEVILKLTASIHPVKGRSVAANAFLEDPMDRLVQRLCLRNRD